ETLPPITLPPITLALRPVWSLIAVASCTEQPLPNPFSDFDPPANDFVAMTLYNMVTIPNWGLKGDWDDSRGPDMSANSLGLVVNEVYVDNPDPVAEQKEAGLVTSLNPPAGTRVPRGTVVTVTMWDHFPFSG
ncbi:MAG: PASTA domain-containing protein, partial [Candidatus Nitrosopolaris sp.]